MIKFYDVNFETSIGNISQLIDSNLPEIVFSGRSNVGKSCLINKLVNRKSLARTSSKPGKTITINFYKFKDFRFVDLPGYGYAKVSFEEKQRWGELVEFYFNSNRKINLVVQSIDIRHIPTDQDFQVIDFLYKKKINFVIVATKCDKLNKTERVQKEISLNKELEKYQNIKKIIFSSVTGEGLKKLNELISAELLAHS